MRHKKIDQVYAYTYCIKNKITGQKYHGVRYANIKLNKTPIEDFANIYFSSGKLAEDFRNNSTNYRYRICLTFDSIEEALAHESLVNTKLMHLSDWEVWNNSKAIVYKVSPSLGRKVKGTAIADKISKSNSGKIRSDKVKNNNSLKQKSRVLRGMHYWQTKTHASKTSIRMKKDNPSKKGLSEEHKKKISISQKGIPKGPQSEQHRLNSSLAHKGHIPWNKGLSGVTKVSDETKQKMRESKLGKKRGKYNLKKTPNGTKHLQGKKICCMCCKKEWDLGNFAKHLRK